MPDKLKEIDLDKDFQFSEQVVNFSETDTKGEFEGYLVVYNTDKLAHGVFRFAEGSMKVNEGKKLFMLYQHNGYSQIPVGVMTGRSDEKGFKVTAKFDLAKNDNGDYVNPEAAKIYSLMKDMGAEFQLSAGGKITRKEIVNNDEERFILIKEFEAHEGSIVMRGAVEGSRVEAVFSEDDQNNNQGEDNDMDPDKLREMLQEQFSDLQEDMLNAQSQEEIDNLKEDFEEFEERFEGLEDNIKAEFEERFEQINDVIKTLKESYEPTEKEFEEAEQLKAIFEAAKKDEDTLLSDEEDLELSADTTSHPAAIKSTYVRRILERIQDANPILKDINFMSISNGSLNIPREMLGLPEAGWVGETDSRTETNVNELDDVDIDIHQLYVLPIVSNKFLNTNYVKYLPFLMRRTEYAMSLKLANAVFNGTGSKQPTGVLNDTNVTNSATFDLTTDGSETDDAKFIEKIISIYYSVRSEIASNAKWYMRRETWARISKLKNTNDDFYITDLNTGDERTLMTRPVELVESDGSGLKPIDTAENDDPIMVFGDFKNGIQGIKNNKMNIRIEDRITSKGFTKYYLEKGVGLGVQLPERFVKIKVSKDVA